MSNIKDNSEYWAKGLTVAVDRPTLLTESPAHTSKQYYIQAENVFVVVQAPDYIPGSDGGPEVVFANGRIGLLKNLTGDVDLEGALLVANNLSDLANTAAARTNLGLGSLAIKNSVDNNDWAGADLSISNGGTGASDAAEARSNLGLGDLATQSTVDNTDWFGDALEVANGGTGASDAAGARTNLGLGGLSTKSTINNNDWSGVDLDVSNGGTGASDAPSARTNLGLGDAATRTVQTSPTDTTAGRLMPVGAFGIGVENAGGPSITNLDTHRTSGMFWFGNSAVGTPTDDAGVLIHSVRSSFETANPGHFQTIYLSSRCYTRYSAAGTWSGWKEVVFNGDSPTFPQVTLENTSDNRPSILRAFAGAGRRLLQIFSKSTSTNGAAIYLYGDDDSSSPNRILCYVGNSEAALILDPESNGGAKVRDYAGTARRVGWVPALIFITGSENLQNRHLNNTNFINSASVTLTIPSGVGNDGQLVTIMTGANGFTVAQGSGVTLTWHQGGSASSGNRTVAPNSVITLCRTSSTVWRIWGNGIS